MYSLDLHGLGDAQAQVFRGFGDATGVRALQTALTRYGLPTTVDGIVGPQTLTNLGTVVTKLPGVPEEWRPYLFGAITIALAMGKGSSAYTTVVDFVNKNAMTLAAAVGVLSSRGDTPTASGFPEGSYQRYHISRKTWRAYAPTANLSGLEGVGGIGDELATLIAENAAKFPGLPEHPPEDYPFYKKTWFWGAVAGGVVVIGGGTWYMLRKK